MHFLKRKRFRMKSYVFVHFRPALRKWKCGKEKVFVSSQKLASKWSQTAFQPPWTPALSRHSSFHFRASQETCRKNLNMYIMYPISSANQHTHVLRKFNSGDCRTSSLSTRLACAITSRMTDCCHRPEFKCFSRLTIAKAKFIIAFGWPWTEFCWRSDFFYCLTSKKKKILQKITIKSCKKVL